MQLRSVLLSCAFMLLGLAAFAQYDFPKFEVAVDYSYARFSPSHNYIKNSYSLNGGGGSFEYNFGYLGVKAEFDGYGSSTQNFSAPAGSTFCPNGCTANVQGNLFTYLFGPQVGLRTGKFRPFGELLFGGAHSNVYGNISKIPGITTGRSKAPSLNAFAMTVGGGLDIMLNQSGSIALRPGKFDYLYTRFNTSSINATGQSAQSNFRYQAGLVFNF